MTHLTLDVERKRVADPRRLKVFAAQLQEAAVVVVGREPCK